MNFDFILKVLTFLADNPQLVTLILDCFKRADAKGQEAIGRLVVAGLNDQQGLLSTLEHFKANQS